MAVADSVRQSTEPTTDALSPTTIVLQALKAAGVPLTADNIRRYVASGMRQTGESGTDLRGDAGDILRAENPGESADSAARGSVSRRIERGNPPAADLTHGPTNEAEQPNTAKTTSAAPDVSSIVAPAMRALVPNIPVAGTPQPTPSQGAEYVGNAQPASGRSMTIDPTAIGQTSNPALSGPAQPTLMEQAMTEALSGPAGSPALPPPPTAPQIGGPPNVPQLSAPARQLTGPPGAPEAPMADPNTAIPLQRPPGFQVENVPMSPPQSTIQAPPASSIPSSGLSIEDRMMPGRGNLTIPPSAGPIVEETTPILNRIVRGAASGAGVGRLAGPWGTFIGGAAGAAPGLMDLGRHIVGR